MKNITQEGIKLINRFLSDSPQKTKFIELVDKSKSEQDVEVTYVYFISEVLSPANFTEEEKNLLLFVFTVQSYAATKEITELRGKLLLDKIEKLIAKYGGEKGNDKGETLAKSILGENINLNLN